MFNGSQPARVRHQVEGDRERGLPRSALFVLVPHGAAREKPVVELGAALIAPVTTRDGARWKLSHWTDS